MLIKSLKSGEVCRIGLFLVFAFLILSVVNAQDFVLNDYRCAEKVFTIQPDPLPPNPNDLSTNISGQTNVTYGQPSTYTYSIYNILLSNNGTACENKIVQTCNQYTNENGQCGSSNCTCWNSTCTDYQEYCKRYENYDCNCKTQSKSCNCRQVCAEYKSCNCHEECAQYGNYQCNCGYKPVSCNCHQESYSCNCNYKCTTTYTCSFSLFDWSCGIFSAKKSKTTCNWVCDTCKKTVCDTCQQYSCDTCTGCISKKTVCDQCCNRYTTVCDTCTYQVCDTCQRCAETGYNPIDVDCMKCNYTLCQNNTVPTKYWFEYKFKTIFSINNYSETKLFNDKLCLEPNCSYEYKANFKAQEELAPDTIGQTNVTLTVTDILTGKISISTFIIYVEEVVRNLGFFPESGNSAEGGDGGSSGNLAVLAAAVASGAAAAVAGAFLFRKKIALDNSLATSLKQVSDSIQKVETVFTSTTIPRTPNIYSMPASERDRIIDYGNVKRFLYSEPGVIPIPVMNLKPGTIFSGNFIVKSGAEAGPADWIAQQQEKAKNELAELRQNALDSLMLTIPAGFTNDQLNTVLSGGTVNLSEIERQKYEAYIKELTSTVTVIPYKEPPQTQQQPKSIFDQAWGALTDLSGHLGNVLTGTWNGITSFAGGIYNWVTTHPWETLGIIAAVAATIGLAIITGGASLVVEALGAGLFTIGGVTITASTILEAAAIGGLVYSGLNTGKECWNDSNATACKIAGTDFGGWIVTTVAGESVFRIGGLLLKDSSELLNLGLPKGRIDLIAKDGRLTYGGVAKDLDAPFGINPEDGKLYINPEEAAKLSDEAFEYALSHEAGELTKIKLRAEGKILSQEDMFSKINNLDVPPATKEEIQTLIEDRLIADKIALKGDPELLTKWETESNMLLGNVDNLYKYGARDADIKIMLPDLAYLKALNPSDNALMKDVNEIIKNLSDANRIEFEKMLKVMMEAIKNV